MNITDLFGKEGMAGVIAYLAVAYLLSGPVSDRHADRHLVPACQAGQTSQAPRFKSLEDVARDVTADALEQHGGGIGKGVAALLRYKSLLDKQQATANAAASASTCACRVRYAMRKPDVRWSWTIYVASWKLVSDAPEQTLAAAAAINPEGLCSGGRT